MFRQKIYFFILLLASRSREGCVNLMRDMEEQAGLRNVSCVKVDLSDVYDISKFTARFEERQIPVDILVHAAGVLRDFPSGSSMGFDRAYAVNHLGHAVLTELLLPSLHRSASRDRNTRIVSVNCGAHRYASLLPEQVHREYLSGRSGYQAYAISKYGQLAYSRNLSDRFKKYGIAITVNSVNPGAFIETKLSKSTFFYETITRLANKFGLSKSREQAAAEVVFAATHPSLHRVTGKYFENYRVRSAGFEFGSKSF